MKRFFLLTGLIVSSVAFGFLREYIFEHINSIIESGADVNGRYVVIKWVLTFAFSLLYLIITGAFLQLIFHSRKYLVMTAWVYLLLFGVSFLIFIGGMMFSSFSAVYLLMRQIM
ncbi:MAG TPA: hypothetical protein VII99_00440, partial [Bacteroidia bacterium]